MKKTVFFISFLLFIFISCSKENQKFEFGKNHVGPLRPGIQPGEVKSLFPNDSIGKLKEQNGIVTQKTLKIFDKKTGQPLLALIFQNKDDSLKLHAVEILSKKYISERGVPAYAPFKDWKSKHKITKADRTLKHIIVYVDDLNATLTFTEEDLPYTAQHRPLTKVEPDWIKNNSKPANVTVFFDNP